MNKLKRVIIKEEYVAITGDTLEAIILSQMIYWSERIKDFDKFIEEENERSQKYYIGTPENAPKEIELTHGWIYKKAAELKDEIMATDSEKTINRKMISLFEKGFLDRRHNPTIKYDRTYQYRVNFPNIIKALIEKGYMLQDYKVSLDFIAEALKTLNGQNDESNETMNEESKGQIDELKSQIDELKKQIVVLKSQGDATIPEITTQTTTQTTTEKEVALSSNNLDKFFNSIKAEMLDLNLETGFNSFIKDLSIIQTENKIIITATNNFIVTMIKNKYLVLIEIHLRKYFEFENIEVLSKEE